MQGARNLSVAFCLVFLATGSVEAGVTDDEAVGQVMAAVLVADGCKGIGMIGGGDTQTFVMAATDLLAQQGFGREQMRGILFYGKTEVLRAAGVRALAARGVTASDTGALCGFGRKLAGTADAIGRFMVKGD